MVGKNENILVEFDYQNVVLIDPNKIINEDGKVTERMLPPENLVCYANLECVVTPRTRLLRGIDGKTTQQIISIATINFLKPGNSQFLTTDYYDEITGLGSLEGKGVNQIKEKKSDNPSGFVRETTNNLDTGLLGIKQISINTSFAGYSDVTIVMEDVRGRALFEKGEASPYAAFFTYPYPIFYLTVKGYLGKAVRYQLALKTFTADYDPNTGNFRITVKFLTYQFNVLSSIPMKYLLALPYMYETKYSILPENNPNLAKADVKTIPVSKGLQKIREVYKEYKSKGIIVDEFPEMPLQEFLVRLEIIEKNLLNTFSEEDLSPLTDFNNYIFDLNQYLKEVLTARGSSWVQEYLDVDNFYIEKDTNVKLYTFKKETRQSGNRQLAVEKLKSIIKTYNEKLKNNPTFGNGKKYSINNSISYETIVFDKPTISLELTFKERTGKTKEQDETGFDTFSQDIDALFNSVGTDSQDKKESFWFKLEGDRSFSSQIESMNKQANDKMKKIEEELSNKLSQRLQEKDGGLGFKPTMRNLVAVLMANAEAFLRVMCDVHSQAWSKRDNKLRRDAVIDSSKDVPSPDSKDFVNEGNGDLIPIYPWPHFFVENNSDTGERYVLAYPGDPNYIFKTKAYLSDIWPEVQFVEEFLKGFVKTKDNKKDETFSNIINQEQVIQRISLNSIDFPTQNSIYGIKQEIKFFFEIYERVFLSAFYQMLPKPGTEKNITYLIAENEATNIINSLSFDNPYLIQKLKNFAFTSENFLGYLASISNDSIGESYQKFVRDLFVTNYIQENVENSFLIFENSILNPNSLIVNPSTVSLQNLENYLKETKSNVFEFTDIFPFVVPNWYKIGLADSDKVSDLTNIMNTTKTLFLNEDKKVISNFKKTTTPKEIRPITNFNFYKTPVEVPDPAKSTFDVVNLKTFYENRVNDQGLKSQLPTEGGLFYKNYTGQLTSTQTTSILNTPYFTNSILEGVKKFTTGNKFPFVSTAYLFLNSLPLATLREKYKTFDGTNTTDLDYIFATFKKFGAVHKVPYAWVLKYGSIWHRYKKWIDTGKDILSDVWKDFDAVKNFDPITQNPAKEYQLDIDGVTQKITLTKDSTVSTDTITEIGVGFYPNVLNDFNIFFRGFGLFSLYDNTDIQNIINNNVDSIKLMLNDSSSFNLNKNYDSSNPNNILRFRAWSCSLYDKKNNVHYITPSFGANINQTRSECVDKNNKLKNPIKNNPAVFNGSLRGMWALPNYGYFDNLDVDIPSPDEYMKTILVKQSQQESFSINVKGDYTSIEDIFSVFDKKILDLMEKEFLSFSKSMFDIDIVESATTTGNVTIATVDLMNITVPPDAKFKNLQTLLVEIFKVGAIDSQNSDEFIIKAQEKQLSNLINNVQQFLEYDVVIKFGNPSFYERKLFDSFSTVNFIEDKYTFQTYVPNSLPTSGGTTLLQSRTAYPETWKALETHVGFSNIPGLEYSDAGSAITDFFIDANIIFNEDSVVTLAPIIKIYASRKSTNPNLNWEQFINDLDQYVIKNNTFINEILNRLFEKLRKDLPNIVEVESDAVKKSALQSDVVPLSLYDSFKGLNDKWISGYDYTQKTMMEDVLLVDRASRNIGDKVFFDPLKVRKLLNYDLNPEATVFMYISSVIREHNFHVSMMPSYVNFYNVQDIQKDNIPRTEGTLEFGNTMFGTFMNVDTRQSSPKLLCVLNYIPSEHLATNKDKNNRFRNDSFEFRRTSESPLLDKLEGKKDWGLSNKVVGFSVDVGIRNQNVFKNISVRQDNGKDTIESLMSTEQMLKQYKGKQVATQNISLWDYYNKRNYSADVVCLGNAMIQPTMYFNLRYIPMFYGPYLIESVKHDISVGNFETSFKGVRQQMFSFPEITNFLQIMTKQLFSEIKQRILQQTSSSTTNSNAAVVTNVTQTTSTNTTVNSSPNACENNLYTTYKSQNFIVANQQQTSKSVKDLLDILKTKIPGNSQSEINTKLMTFITIWKYSYASGQFVAFNNNFSGAELTINWGTNLNNLVNKSYVCLKNNFTNVSNPNAVFNTFNSNVDFTIARWRNFAPSVNTGTLEGVVEAYYRYWNTNPKTIANFNEFKNNTKAQYDELVSRIRQGYEYFNSLSSVPTSNIKLVKLGEFNSINGNGASYFNVKKADGKYISFRIVDPDYRDTKVGGSSYTDANGNVVPFNCSQGISFNFTYECTVNGQTSGTYKLIVSYRLDDGSFTNLVSEPFTQ